MRLKGKKILVTGGAGFIGSHLVEKLVELGAEVSVADDFSRGTRKNLKTVKNQITIYKVDLRQEKKLAKIFHGQEIIFNLAALNTGVDFDKGRTQIMFEENMLLQMMPIRVAAKTPSVKKFIQVSSASVYSKKAMEEQVPTPEHANTFDPEPSKLGYALAKKMGEYLAKWYAENTKLWTISVRFINVYGERDNFDEMSHFIPAIIRKFIEAKKKVVVFGSGNQKRSFIYVSDVISALLLLLDKGEKGEAYNIDGQEEKSVKEVVNLVHKHLKKDQLEIVYDTSLPEGSQRRMLDNTKLKALSWQPETTFEEGLQKTIAYMQKELQAR